MQVVNGGETDVDVVFVDTFKIGNRRHGDANRAEMYGLVKQVFGGQGIEEIVLCLFDDVGGVDEEEEVPIAFFVEVENQARHDEGFAAAGCHIEQEMEGRLFARKVVFETEERTGRRLPPDRGGVQTRGSGCH